MIKVTYEELPEASYNPFKHHVYVYVENLRVEGIMAFAPIVAEAIEWVDDHTTDETCYISGNGSSASRSFFFLNKSDALQFKLSLRLT